MMNEDSQICIYRNVKLASTLAGFERRGYSRLETSDQTCGSCYMREALDKCTLDMALVGLRETLKPEWWLLWVGDRTELG